MKRRLGMPPTESYCGIMMLYSRTSLVERPRYSKRSINDTIRRFIHRGNDLTGAWNGSYALSLHVEHTLPRKGRRVQPARATKGSCPSSTFPGRTAPSSRRQTPWTRRMTGIPSSSRRTRRGHRRVRGP